MVHLNRFESDNRQTTGNLDDDHTIRESTRVGKAMTERQNLAFCNKYLFPFGAMWWLKVQGKNLFLGILACEDVPALKLFCVKQLGTQSPRLYSIPYLGICWLCCLQNSRRRASSSYPVVLVWWLCGCMFRGIREWYLMIRRWQRYNPTSIYSGLSIAWSQPFVLNSLV